MQNTKRQKRHDGTHYIYFTLERTEDGAAFGYDIQVRSGRSLAHKGAATTETNKALELAIVGIMAALREAKQLGATEVVLRHQSRLLHDALAMKPIAGQPDWPDWDLLLKLRELKQSFSGGVREDFKAASARWFFAQQTALASLRQPKGDAA